MRKWQALNGGVRRAVTRQAHKKTRLAQRFLPISLLSGFGSHPSLPDESLPGARP